MPFFLAGKCYVSSLWSYSKDTIRAGCDNGKGGIVAVLRQRPREKFRFVSGSGFFFTVASFNRVRACTCVCGRSCIVHGGRAALDKSPFDVCLSDFEWNGNRGWRKQGGRRSRKYHFSWYHTLLSCLAFATDYERKGLLNRGLEISSGTKKNTRFSNDVKIILTNFRACWRILYAVPRKFACLNENPRNGGTFPE